MSMSIIMYIYIYIAVFYMDNTKYEVIIKLYSIQINKYKLNISTVYAWQTLHLQFYVAGAINVLSFYVMV